MEDDRPTTPGRGGVRVLPCLTFKVSKEPDRPLGILMEHSTTADPTVTALVIGVVEGGPAAKAGIKVADVVVRVNGGEVRDADHGASLMRAAPAGDVAVVVRRGRNLSRPQHGSSSARAGASLFEAFLGLGARAPRTPHGADDREDLEMVIIPPATVAPRQLGIKLVSKAAGVNTDYLQMRTVRMSVYVRSLGTGSLGAAVGLHVGDRIVSVGGRPPASAQAVLDAVAKRGEQAVAIVAWRAAVAGGARA